MDARKMMNIKYLWGFIIIFVMLFSLPVNSETFYLMSVDEGKMPRVEKQTIIYTIDFMFLHAPENYWIYYDPALKKCVIDFYDARIEGPGSEFKENSLFSTMEIKNVPSSMALSNNRAQIVFPLDSGWHVESKIQNGKAIELIFWKKLVIKQTRHAYHNSSIPYIVAISSVCIIFILVLLSLGAR
jgi:hypothetical protein